MRLATVRAAEGRTRLYVLGSSGWIEVAEAARALGLTELDVVEDVGSLYRAGEGAVDLVRRISAEPRSAHQPAQILAELTLAPVVTRPGSIVCVGRNYLEHIHEGSAPVPAEPILFAKYPNTLVGDGEPVVAHPIATELDYEGELALVIGHRARRVPASAWRDVVAGYTIINDISDRYLQKNDVQWIRGKSLDSWAPLGPIFVSADEIPDPHALRIRTRVNGEARQDAPTSDMLFRIPELIAFITEAITLEPGDLVATGTPSGVGLGFDPPKWLRPGDVVEVEIDGIGVLRSPVVG
jgi:2-keto-4-pentenoate hydratase/2-oxohepta-3-ene-1,7-dioic acid hydratase in catechol pathway